MKKSLKILIISKTELILIIVLIANLFAFISCNKKVKYIDIPYASISKAQMLDLYLPEKGDGPFPVVITIHGGSFKEGEKWADQRLWMEGIKHGYAVICINYRLSGEAKFPAQLNDVKAAIRWVRANTDVYNLDGNKIALWGYSAGGNLAALAGLSSNVKELEDLSLGNPDRSCNVQAVIDFFGPINFLTIDSQFAVSKKGKTNNSDANSWESQYFGRKITEIPEIVKKSNPETYITKDAPPVFIDHGSDDNIVPVEQSIDFAEKLKETAGKDKVVFEIIEGAGHGGDQFSTPENMAKVFIFLDKYLK